MCPPIPGDRQALGLDTGLRAAGYTPETARFFVRLPSCLAPATHYSSTLTGLPPNHFLAQLIICCSLGDYTFLWALEARADAGADNFSVRPSSTADASNTGHLFFDVLTPDASLTFLSGRSQQLCSGIRNAAPCRPPALRHRPRRVGSARLAQEAEERCSRSRLIKTPDRISERPPRGGLSVSGTSEAAKPRERFSGP